MSTVENVWSNLVKDKEALLIANMKDIGWLKSDHSNSMVGLFGIKKNVSSLSKKSVFRRWRLYHQKSKFNKKKDTIEFKKALFLKHLVKIYRLLLINQMRKAFHTLYQARPPPLSFCLSKIVPGINEQKYDKWGDPILSRRKDKVLILGDGSIVLNLTKNIY